MNLFFLIGATMQLDPRSSASNCEVFARRYGCQHENMCHCLNLLTVLGTDAAISMCRDSRVPEGISGIHGQLVSASSKCVSKFVSYLKSYPYHEIPGWLTLNQIIINQCSKCFQDPINDLTVVADDERHSGRRLCIFDVESISICDGGTPIDVTKVAIHHDSGAPQGNTK